MIKGGLSVKNKKVTSIIIMLLTAASLYGCNQKNDSVGNTASPKNETKQEETKNSNKSEETKVTANTQTVDGLTLTVNAKIGTVKGDRTKDNVGDEKGEYIADGSDIVKASDYKSIIINVDIKNDSDRVAELSQLYWSGELQDGYKLNNTLLDDGKDSQIQAKTSGKYEFQFLVKKDIKAEKIKLDYLWIKNTDEFQKLIQDPSVSQLTQQEVAEKYKDVFSTIKLQTDIKN